jgi:hypothetical protein
MVEALRSSEVSVLARAALRNIPEDGILQLSIHYPFRYQNIMQINTELRWERKGGKLSTARPY